MNALVIVMSLAALASEAKQPDFEERQVNNPLTAKWTGPYHGLPPFDVVKVADLKPALEADMNISWPPSTRSR